MLRGIAMTWKQAFLRCMFSGLVANEVATKLAKSRDWYDDDCSDMTACCRTLRELGDVVDKHSVAKCLCLLGYSFDEAAELVAEAIPVLEGPEDLQHYARLLENLVSKEVGHGS
jgi:hypothetical protein